MVQAQHTHGLQIPPVIGKLLYPMMKYQPDISFYVLNLSQHMENPAEIHYMALKQI
jgi:hypothetical protein